MVWWTIDKSLENYEYNIYEGFILFPQRENLAELGVLCEPSKSLCDSDA